MTNNSDELRAHRELVDFARTTTTDLYALLKLSSPVADPTSNPSSDAIKKAFKFLAIKIHPDKNPGREVEAAKEFDEVSRARDALLDDEARAAFDSQWRAKAEQRVKHEALDAKRRRMVDDLKDRENAVSKARKSGTPYVFGTKSRAEDDEREAKIVRIAAEGRRRREAKDEENRRLREQQKKARAEAEEDADMKTVTSTFKTSGVKYAEVTSQVEEIDRSVRVGWVKSSLRDGKSITTEVLKQLFSVLGNVDGVALLKDQKAIPIPGGLAGSLKPSPIASTMTQKEEMGFALVVFESIVSAHAAVLEAPKLAALRDEWMVLDSVQWASGTGPDLDSSRTSIPYTLSDFTFMRLREAAKKQDPRRPALWGLRKEENVQRLPSFKSFKSGRSGKGLSREAAMRRAEDEIRKAENGYPAS